MNARCLLPLFAVPSLLVACGGQPPAPQSSASASTPAAASASAAASAPTAASSAGAPAADAPLPEPIATAMGRVRAMLDSVDDAKIKEAFSPDFLASVPPTQVTSVFADLRKKVGACSAQQALAVRGSTAARFRITCERGNLDAKLIVDAVPPFLIKGLLIRVAED